MDSLIYPEKTMYQMIRAMAEKYPKEPALEFYGKKISYAKLNERITALSRAFAAGGIRQGDRVTICMPNVPQAIECFYALDRIGAVANMVHPLSARNEIAFYLNLSKSKMIVTLDMFCEKVEEALEITDHHVTIVAARMQETLPKVKAAGYLLTKGRPFLKYPRREDALLYEKFIRDAKDAPMPEEVPFKKNRTSVILYSGGTSGLPKGICLSDLNMNALGLQCRSRLPYPFEPGVRMLSCMPVFHGFGLGVNIHTVLIHGACACLLPTFTIKTYAEALIKKKPNFIAGVPTIFEALLHMPMLDGVKLDYLTGMFCGGDSLSVELKKKVDTFLKEHGAKIQVQEGYGLTECVTASCLTPADDYREGSIGLPFPDTQYAIVRPDTDDVLEPGQEGEIILKGPTVMLGYLDNPEETKKTLRKLADGDTWLYTGDLGRMDEDGFVYFSQRIKRMIITNGYNVYPGQIENVIDACPEVAYSCVIGVKDERRGQRVRAYVVLRDGIAGDEAMKEKIMETLKLHVAGYALPKEIIFRDELPKLFRELE